VKKDKLIKAIRNANHPWKPFPQDHAKLPDQVAKWMAKLCRWRGDNPDNVTDSAIWWMKRENRWLFAVYTPLHKYSITFVMPGDDGPGDGHGYIGAIVTNRLPRPGEEHHRGSDMADGPYCAATWTKVLSDILGYEVELGPRPE